MPYICVPSSEFEKICFILLVLIPRFIFKLCCSNFSKSKIGMPLFSYSFEDSIADNSRPSKGIVFKNTDVFKDSKSLSYL